MDFVHLHTHSHYSILDGLSSPKDLVARAKELKFKALALTDHGSCAGLYNFQKACIKEGIKPILGNEMYITSDRLLKSTESKTYHLVLLAKNAVGVSNLMYLNYIAEKEGKYRKPRIDMDILKNHHAGLIALSACPVGEIPVLLWDGNTKMAYDLADQYRDLFGEDFYIEIMFHKYFNNKDQQNKERDTVKNLLELSKKMNIKAVATNDIHYALKEDYEIHDVMLSMQTHNHIKNPKRFTFDSDEFYMKSYEEMLSIFPSYEYLLSNTNEIAEKISADAIFSDKEDLLPTFVIPPEFTSENEYLKVLVKAGMIEKGFLKKQEYRDRIKFEMDTIIRCNYTKYFLILWDIVNYAKRNNLRVGIGRGSAVGSLTLYCLGITNLDPIEHDLLFERFLNPERISPPDVDMDFDYDRRDEIFKYVIDKYGDDHCAKIGTYMTLKARAVIRYVAKALDIGNDWERYQNAKQQHPDSSIEMTKQSLNMADIIAKSIPNGPNVTVESALKDSPEFASYMKKYPLLLKCAKKLEGKVSSAGVHAAGIVVCKNLIHNHVPIRESKGQICSQFDGPEVEELGLLKFDFLGLTTLTIIDKAQKMYEQRHDKKLNLDNLTPNDKDVFALLNGKKKNMDTRGIFQFEGDGISGLLNLIRVDTFDDMVVANALYRPGPLGGGVHKLYADYKHGRQPIKPLHPKMGELLKKTYSIMCYQEDLMKVSQELAGFTKGESDTLRKAIGKKKLDLLASMREKFVDGCSKNGINTSLSKQIFDQIEFFGGYGFNKCLSGDTCVKNKIDGKILKLEEMADGAWSFENSPVILDSYVDGKMVEDEVVEVFSTGEQEVFEVEMDNGIIIKCTLEHKFICSDGNKHEMWEIVDDCLDIVCFNNIQSETCRIKYVDFVGVIPTFNVTMKGEQHNYSIFDPVTEQCIISLNSHSAAYSFISYQTAYLKVHCSIEFMCSLLSAEVNNQDKDVKLNSYIREATRMGIVIKGPDINKSDKEFLIEQGKNRNGEDYEFLRSPLTMVKGVGEKAVLAIVKHKPFKNMQDFFDKIDGNSVTKRVFEALVEHGCMDESWRMNRNELLAGYDNIRQEVSTIRKNKKEQKEEAEKFTGCLFDV